MNDDLLLVSRVLQEQDIETVLRAGIKHEALLDDGRQAFKWVNDFWAQHGGLPALDTVERELSIEIPTADEPLGFYIEKIQARYRASLAKDAVRSATDSLKAGDTAAAFSSMGRALEIEASLSSGKKRVTDLADGVLDVAEDYERVSRATTIDGIPLPWQFMNDATWGMHPGELWITAGRLGTGKTWDLLCCASSAYDAGARSLFVSTEMGIRAVMRRFVALRTRMPYKDVKRGKLPAPQQKAFFAAMEVLAQERDRIWFIPPGRCRSLTDVRVLVRQYRPRVLFIDSFYRLEPAEHQRGSLWEKILQVSGGLKTLLEDEDIPGMVTTQLSREAVKGKSKKSSEPGQVGAEMLSFGDSVGYNADYVVAMEQTEDMRRSREMYKKFIKTRDDEAPPGYVVEWNFDTMSFREKGVADDLRGDGETETVEF